MVTYTQGGFGAAVDVGELGEIAKGGLIAGDGSGAPQVLTVGSNNQALIADSTETLGVRWGSAGALSFIGEASGTGTSAVSETELDTVSVPASSLTNEDKLLVLWELGRTSGSIKHDLAKIQIKDVTSAVTTSDLITTAQSNIRGGFLITSRRDVSNNTALWGNQYGIVNSDLTGGVNPLNGDTTETDVLTTAFTVALRASQDGAGEGILWSLKVYKIQGS